MVLLIMLTCVMNNYTEGFVSFPVFIQIL